MDVLRPVFRAEIEFSLRRKPIPAFWTDEILKGKRQLWCSFLAKYFFHKSKAAYWDFDESNWAGLTGINKFAYRKTNF